MDGIRRSPAAVEGEGPRPGGLLSSDVLRGFDPLTRWMSRDHRAIPTALRREEYATRLFRVLLPCGALAFHAMRLSVGLVPLLPQYLHQEYMKQQCFMMGTPRLL